MVCEPMIRVSLEIPAETVGSVLAAVARLGGDGAPDGRWAWRWNSSTPARTGRSWKTNC